MRFEKGNKLQRKFQPGQSGNPKGRPKSDLAGEIVQAVFEKNEQAVYRARLKALKKGNPTVFQVLADRAYGKLKEPIELHSSDRFIETIAEARRRLAAAKARPRAAQASEKATPTDCSVPTS